MKSRRARSLKVLITRSKEGNAEFASRLRKAGAAPIEFETLSFYPPPDWSRVDQQLKKMDSFDWLIFTSATGVKYFAARVRKRGLRLGRIKDRPRVAAIGEKTEAALKREGIRVDFTPSEYLTSVLGRELPADFGKKVLLLRADIAGPELVGILKERSFVVDEEAIYRTNGLGEGEKLEKLPDADLVAFMSPSAVRSFCNQVPDEVLAPLRGNSRAACIGPITDRAAKEAGFRTIPYPKRHTMEGLIEAIRSYGKFA